MAGRRRGRRCTLHNPLACAGATAQVHHLSRVHQNPCSAEEPDKGVARGAHSKEPLLPLHFPHAWINVVHAMAGAGMSMMMQARSNLLHCWRHLAGLEWQTADVINPSLCYNNFADERQTCMALSQRGAPFCQTTMAACRIFPLFSLSKTPLQFSRCWRQLLRRRAHLDQTNMDIKRMTGK